jgi:flagellar protein FliS
MVAQDQVRAYRANSVLTASPGQLVLMLYDGALRALRIAGDAFAQGDSNPRRFESINTNLLKAQAIISELQGTLDHQAGGEFAATMHRLYDYYNRRLLEANLRKDPAPVAEVERLLREVRDAWAEMLLKQEPSRLEGLRVVA